MMNKIKELNNIIKNLYQIYGESHNKTFNINLGEEPIYELCKNIGSYNNIIDVSISKPYNKSFKDFDGDTVICKQYDLLIKSKFGNIGGFIRCCPADETNTIINIILGLYPNTTAIIESLNESNEGFKFDDFVKALKKCESFNDVKQTVKKYSSEGIMLGTLLTCVMINFALGPNQFDIVYNEAINNYDSYDNYNYDNYDSYDNISYTQVIDEPIWILLCSDTETTVYNAVPEQCNNDVRHTASMFRLNLNNPESHKIIAMERSMMKEYGLNYGDLVKVEGTGKRDGVYQIQDTMNKRFKGQHKIDILINNDSPIGKWNNVKVYKLDNPYDCYHKLKKDMANALNQQSINKRQEQYN